MARIVNIVLGAVATAAVAVLAVVVGREEGLLGGALVVLAAMIGLVLVNRLRASRHERSAKADWEHVLDVDAPAEAFFSDWTATSPRAHREALGAAELQATPADALDPTPAPTPVEPAVAPAAPHEPAEPAESSSPTAAGSAFPFDDDDGFGDLPPLRPAARPTPDPLDLSSPAGPDDGPGLEPAPPAPPAPAIDLPRAAPEPPHVPVVPAARTDEAVVLPEASPLREESYSMAGAVPSTNGTARRSVIDWTGPTRIDEEQVRTSDDILAASAATALPTAAEDAPAPAPGSELARLLAKVEARLRDYE